MQKNVINELEAMWYGDGLWRKRAVWELRFAWFPRRCALTHKLIWLNLAYMGTVIYTGPGESVVEFRWHEANEHLIWLLKS